MVIAIRELPRPNQVVDCRFTDTPKLRSIDKNPLDDTRTRSFANPEHATETFYYTRLRAFSCSNAVSFWSSSRFCFANSVSVLNGNPKITSSVRITLISPSILPSSLPSSLPSRWAALRAHWWSRIAFSRAFYMVLSSVISAILVIVWVASCMAVSGNSFGSVAGSYSWACNSQ